MIIHKQQNKNNMSSILTEFSKEELESVIEENSSLRGYLQGYLAEVAFKREAMVLPHISKITKIPDQDPEKGDFKILYKDTFITIEIKSVLTNSVKEDVLNDTWQGTVNIKNTDRRDVEIEGLGIISSSCLHRGQFDILAISCYAVSGKWDFVYIENEYIPSKGITPTLLKSTLVINPETTPCLITDLTDILESVYNKKQALK